MANKTKTTKNFKTIPIFPHFEKIPCTCMLHQILLFCKKSGFCIEFMFLEFNKSSFQIH